MGKRKAQKDMTVSELIAHSMNPVRASKFFAKGFYGAAIRRKKGRVSKEEKLKIYQEGFFLNAFRRR